MLKSFSAGSVGASRHVIPLGGGRQSHIEIE